MNELFVHQLSYVGLFTFLAGAGTIVPIPEEITLLAAGYFAALGLMDPLIGIPVAISGGLFGDTVLFMLARTGGKYAKRLRERVQRVGLEHTWVFSPTHPLRAVFFLRFVTGLRFISPVYAGFHSVSKLSFLATTLSALLLFVPLLFGIGYYFHNSIARAVAGVAYAQHLLFIGFLCLIGLLMLYTLYRLTRREREIEVIDGTERLP